MKITDRLYDWMMRYPDKRVNRYYTIMVLVYLGTIFLMIGLSYIW